jgi:hypothetical protein
LTTDITAHPLRMELFCASKVEVARDFKRGPLRLYQVKGMGEPGQR